MVRDGMSRDADEYGGRNMVLISRGGLLRRAILKVAALSVK
jgi:hypothetical protein